MGTKEKKYPVYETLKEYLNYASDVHGEKIAFVNIKDNKQITIKDFKDSSVFIAYALSKRLKNRNINCAIVSENSIDYMLAYFGVINSNNTCVLIAGDLDDETLSYQIDFTDCEVLFISSKYIEKLDSIKRNCKKIKLIVLLSCEKDENYLVLNDLIKQGEKKRIEAYEEYNSMVVDQDKMCQILFTSGTVGYNKAVMLSNRNVCCSVSYSLKNYSDFKNFDSTLSILPFYHSFENAAHVLPSLFYGYTNYINDSMSHAVKNMQKYPVQMTVVVPSILDTIVKKMRNEARRLKVDKGLKIGMKASNFNRKIGIDLRQAIFKALLNAVSPTLRTFIVGGASVGIDTYDFLTSLGFTIINGYGETECSPIVASNVPKKQSRLSVGRVIDNMQVKIVNKDKNKNGEILVKGKGVMLGYYKDKEATDKVFTKDGWLKTGDLGHLSITGLLYICGRNKNLIILSNGKNVYPEEIELLLQKRYKYIQEVVVCTDKKQTGIYAYIYPDQEYSEGKTDEELYTAIKKDVASFNAKMPSYKNINDIKVDKNPFEKNINRKIMRPKYFS